MVPMKVLYPKKEKVLVGEPTNEKRLEGLRESEIQYENSKKTTTEPSKKTLCIKYPKSRKCVLSFLNKLMDWP